MAERRRSWWGGGWEDQALTDEQVRSLAGAVAVRLGVDDLEVRATPALTDIDLRPPRGAPPPPPPRAAPPAALQAICSTDRYDRAGHTYGKSFRDVVRGFHGDFPEPPD